MRDPSLFDLIADYPLLRLARQVAYASKTQQSMRHDIPTPEHGKFAPTRFMLTITLLSEGATNSLLLFKDDDIDSSRIENPSLFMARTRYGLSL